MIADLILKNGEIYTLNEQQPVVNKLAIKDGKVLAYDEEADFFINEKTKQVNLDGATVLPGFIESHTHPLDFATNLLKLDLRYPKVKSIQDILDAVHEKAKQTNKGDWILGYGLDESKLKENRYPTIDELSQAAPDHPIFLTRTCNHNAVVNRKALEVSGISEDIKDPQGGHFARDPQTKQLIGLIHENAMEYFDIPDFTIEQKTKAITLAQKQFLHWGITTMHDMATSKEQMIVYQRLKHEQQLTIRLRLWIWALNQMGWKGMMKGAIQLGLQSGFGDDQINIQGLKFMLDGSIGGKTAAVSEPYEGTTKELGILYMDQETINKHVKEAINNHFRVSIHGIGERAIDMAIQAITSAQTADKNQLMRHRIDHCVLPTKQHLEQMTKHQIIAASSVGFIYSIGDSYIQNLGDERVEKAFPHQTFKQYGIIAPGNSDLPVCHGNPFLGIYSAVTRKTVNGQQMGTEETISVEEAIKAYTIDAAFSGFDEKMIGHLSPGAYADLIVLDENPYKVNPEQLKDIQVEKTMVEGKFVDESTNDTLT